MRLSWFLDVDKVFRAAVSRSEVHLDRKLGPVYSAPVNFQQIRHLRPARRPDPADRNTAVITALSPAKISARERRFFSPTPSCSICSIPSRYGACLLAAYVYEGELIHNPPRREPGCVCERRSGLHVRNRTWHAGAYSVSIREERGAFQGPGVVNRVEVD